MKVNGQKKGLSVGWKGLSALLLLTAQHRIQWSFPGGCLQHIKYPFHMVVGQYIVAMFFFMTLKINRY